MRQNVINKLKAEMVNKKDQQNIELIFSGINANNEIIPILTEGDEPDFAEKDFPEELPILPLRNTVLFPGVFLPITVGRKKSLTLVNEVSKGDRLIGTLTQKNDNVNDPDGNELYKIGTIAKIIKVLKMPDGSTSVMIQGLKRFEIVEYTSSEPYLKAKVKLCKEIIPDQNSNEFKAVVGSVKDLSAKIAQYSKSMADSTFVIKNIENPSSLINIVSSSLDLKIKEKQLLLEKNDLYERGLNVVSLLAREVQFFELKKDIQSKVQVNIDQQQREYLLNQQMKTIQNELGGNPVEQEINKLQEKGKTKKWSKEISDYFEKETAKLRRVNAASGEYSIQYSYCQTLLELPWNEYTKDNFDLHHAAEILDKNHYGLEKVKERILEHLAVLKLKKDMKAPILCLYGPPGVGKTSLGKSIADALGRKYVRMSLGGLHDESEIRGHRKTYIGAMPGRIIQDIKKAKSSNPVFVLDEIDKVSNDFHGDPASALLEVLDPEQNSEFHDNYLEVDYDLSRVLFIATANTLNTIAPALRDRLELIDISGYITEEKIEIAKRHLIVKQLKNNGLKKDDIVFSDDILKYIIDNYTRESGVRELDKTIAKICRKIAKEIAYGKSFNKNIGLEDIRKYLGAVRYTREMYEGNEYKGVVTGLAWTAMGGEILFIESSQCKGKGRLTLTGNLGDVMKESAMIAFEYIKSHTKELNITPSFFEKHDYHIHVPEGAIPKDGPSAGVTLTTSLASIITGRKVRKNIAMTGEITLIGKVLPIGGVKEKILAAKRAGIKEILLPSENKKDIDEIKDIYLKGLTFRYVDKVSEVLDYALLKK